ncbi:MAG TPA: RNA-binding protein [Firmicutes bacterium]|nr:RNA-binding protein [Bacillota bacterium]
MFEHFERHERDFVTKAIEWVELVYYSQVVKVTKFLTPREQVILQTVCNQYTEVNVKFDGGFIGAERKRAIISHENAFHTTKGDIVTGIKVIYPARYVNLEHRDILGSLTALKVDRSLIGDIIKQDDTDIFIAICEEYAAFFKLHFNKVGRHDITLIEESIEHIKRIENYDFSEIILASMRLDVVVAGITKKSRQDVSELISSGAVQLNFKLEQNHSRQCVIGDTLSIRKYGRYKLLSQKATTKSGKLIINIGKTIS